MATWYLSADTGNDTTGDGSESTPWLTMGKAHTEATSGDTVICLDSTATYAMESVTFTKDLTIQGQQDDGSGCKWDGSGGSFTWVMQQSGLTMVVEKMQFQNFALNASTALIRITTGNLSTGTLTFRNLQFRTILLGGTSRPAIFASGSNWTTKVITMTVQSCLFDDIYNKSGITTGSIFATYGGPSSVFNLYNNTFYFKENSADKLEYFIKDITGTINFKNNIIDNERGSDLDWGDTHVGDTVNLDYTCINNLTNNPTLGTGSIDADPLFVDPDNDNFNLQPSSPCIDTGIAL